jgi:pilus assembly protein Flp/PilA
MKNWTNIVTNFLRSEDGPTAVEYAVMMALIIVVCFVAITTVGSNTNKNFSNSALKTATGSSSS